MSERQIHAYWALREAVGSCMLCDSTNNSVYVVKLVYSLDPRSGMPADKGTLRFCPTHRDQLEDAVRGRENT